MSAQAVIEIIAAYEVVRTLARTTPAMTGCLREYLAQVTPEDRAVIAQYDASQAATAEAISGAIRRAGQGGGR